MGTTEKPSLQDFHIEGVKHINPSDALEVLKNDETVMLDVREINEVKLESVPLDRVINYPMSVIMDRLSYIAKDQNCSIGRLSYKLCRKTTQKRRDNRYYPYQHNRFRHCERQNAFQH